MKRIAFVILLSVLGYSSQAQQRIDTRQMNFLPGAKPNNILYHDTLYMGSKQFMSLFYRTRDPEIIHYYQKHQSNKIAGNVLGMLGSVSTIVGLAILSDDSGGARWAVAGGGIAATLIGGYLIVKGQQNLLTAVMLFNNKYNRTTLNIGLGNNRAGLAFNF